MSKLMILMASVVMTGVAFSGVTTHFALNTYAQSGIQLVSAESTLAVDYSPYFSMAKDKATVRVLTNGAVWVESAVGGKMDFTFGDIGLYQFVHQVLANGVVVDEMSAFYATAGTGYVDIPNSWTEIPDELFKNCDWLTSVMIPSSVTHIAPTAFAGCSNIVSATIGCPKVAADGLLHRWDFNGDLKDSVGGSDATIVGNVITDGQQYKTPGGSSGSAYIDLGDNLVPCECETVTLEFWATQDYRGSYDRIFDFGSMPAGYDFTRYDTSCYSPDNIRMDWKGNITSFGATGWSLSVGTEYHIAVVYEKGQGSRWIATYYIQDSLGRGEMFKVSREADAGWSFASVGQTEWLLGQPLTCWDSCAKASYNEVRIWSRALTEEEFKTATEDGPDTIKMGTGRIRSIFPDSSIHSVRVNDDVTDLPDGFFSDCTTLESVTLPDALMTVGKEAFKGCSSLAAIGIPSGVMNVGANAFLGCESLNRVDVESLEDWLKIRFVNAAANPLCYGAELYVDGEKIVDLIVPEGICEIGDGAFKWCSDLRSVEIPSWITNVAPTAFAGCSNIVSVGFDAWPNMLYQCELETTGWSAIGDDVYRTDRQNQYDQTLVLKVEVEGPRRTSFRWKATYSGNYLRYYIDGVQQADLRYSSADWQEVQINVTAGHHEVKWEYYNSSNYGDYYGWVDLSGWKSCYAAALFPDSYSIIQQVSFGNDVRNVDEDAFLGCAGLKRVDVASIGDWLKMHFANEASNPLRYGAELYVDGAKVTSLVVPEGVAEIDERAFAGQIAVTNVVLPSSLMNVAATAFAGCSNIVSVEFGGWPNMLHQCELETSGWSAVGDDVYRTDRQNQNNQTLVLKTEVVGPMLASFRWAATYSGNCLRYYIDGVQQSELRYSSASWQEVQIDVPAGRHEIKWEYYNSSNYGDYYGWVDLSGWPKLRFSEPSVVSRLFPDSYSSIQRVTLGNGVTNLGEDAFWGCESLKRVDAESLEDWLKIRFANAAANPLCCGAELYVGGEKIVDLVVPEGIGEIRDGAFLGCSDLRSVVIPSSVTNVAPTAFAGCSNIVSVEFSAWPNMLHPCEPETSGWSAVGDSVYQTDRQNKYNQTLVLKTEVEGPRHTSFRWKATYSGNYLRYYVDGALQSNLRYSSEEWQEVQVDVPAGRHEVKWEYYNSAKYGDYYGWVDLSGWSSYAPAEVSRLFPDSYSNIQRVTLGNGVKNLGKDAFLGCESIMRVDDASLEDWLKIRFANAAANPLCYGAELYVGGEKIVDLVVPEGIDEIGDGAFKGCSDLRSVMIPSSVTNIAMTAFVGCDNITNVVLYGGVSTLLPELVPGTEWIEESGAQEGDKVYRSNAINHNQSTAIAFEIPDGMRQLVFSWKVGSENRYDWLTWYLDDVQIDRISGSRDWVALTNEIDEAAHRLKFIYSKDEATSTSPDCGWVSSVRCSGRIKDLFPDAPLCRVEIGGAISELSPVFFDGLESIEELIIPQKAELPSDAFAVFPKLCSVETSFAGVKLRQGRDGVVDSAETTSGRVVIPGMLNGQLIRSIAEGAFAGMTGITAVELGKGIENVGAGAFDGCVNLSELILPTGIALGFNPFDRYMLLEWVETVKDACRFRSNREGHVSPVGNCSGIVRIPGSPYDYPIVKIAEGAFAGMTGITAIEIGEGIVELGDGAFDGCTSLSSIVLPETLEDFGDNDVREIGRRGGKSGLWVQDGWALGYIGTAPAEVTIPDGVKGIAAYAFAGQYDLERVVLPDSLKFIGKDAFAGCTSLEGVNLPEGCGRIDDGAFRDCTWIQEVSLASGLTNIGAAAFANCAGLSVLIAPEGLKTMGEGAFSNCWRMVSASLPVSLDEVGSNCFWNCKNLSGVTVPTHVQPLKTIFPAAYDALTSIVIAEGEDRLVEGAFDGCATVKEIVLPETVTEIPAAAFRDCVSLERMAFPAAVKSIGDEAFAGCVGLTRLNLPAGLEAIGARAFEGLSELEQVAIPDGVTSIGAGAFAGCGAVRQVRLPGNVTTLAAAFPDAYEKIVRAEVPEGTTELIAGLFDGCAALESFAIPASVTDIGARAFAGCGALKAVALPEWLKTIGGAAFSGVSGILELEIPSSVESLGVGAFTGCAALRSVTLPGDAGTLADIFPDAYRAMVSVTVTDGTETLNDGFFAGCVSLKTVELPTSVAVIGAGAFEDCTSLASVGIPAGVTSLGAGAFRGCSALAEVTLPGGLSVLEDEVFADCALLTSITVPESVTTLGSRVFDGCAALRLVKFIGNAPQVAADAYAGTPSELVTQVATGSRGWDGIATSKNLPEFWPSGTSHGIGWWDPTRFEVTFDYNDGSGTSETVEEITDTTYKLPDADPVHPGAAFLGWWTETVNGARVTPVTRVMRTSAHTLYAHWRPFSYTVTFDANGGTGTMEEQAMTVDEPTSLPSCGFVRIDHDFVGWALEPEGEVAFADGEEVVNLSTEDGGTVRLYAVWTEREWSAADYLGVKGLVFTTDGDADWFPDVETSHDGIGSMRSGEIGIADAGETTRSTLRTTVAGKGTLTFWWKVNCEGPDPDYGDLYDYLEFTVDGERPEAALPIAGDVDWTKVEVRIEGGAATHELAWSFVKDDWDEGSLPDIAWVDELTWTPDPVTVTFDGNGATEGSVPAAVMSVAGVELVLPNAGTLRKGPCKFVGWSDGKRVYAAGETYVVGSADVTLSAVWEEFTIADALNATNLVFTMGGDAVWAIDFETSHDGEASMRSGSVGTSQTSWIETTVDGAGTLTFVWKADGLLNRGKPANYVQYALDGGEPVQVVVCDWTSVEVEVKGSGEHAIRWTYLHTRAQTTGEDCAWLDEVEWVAAQIVQPSVEGDEGATVTGNAETGFVIKPSEGKVVVEVTIPQGVDAAKVTVEVSPKVASVKPNGAKVKIVSGEADITEFLNVPAADGNGVVDLTKATVKEEIVKETMDPSKGAEIKLDAANPTLITPNTRVGLFYQLREGTTLEGMANGDSTIGDGNPWKPEIKVKGGNAAFYSIGVGKGE